MSSPTEQFHVFGAVCAWLLELCGSTQFQEPSEFDDPNSVATSLVSALQVVEITGQIPVHKLRQGCGQVACAVLHALVQRALVAERFLFGDREWKAVPAPRDEKLDGGDVGQDGWDDPEVSDRVLGDAAQDVSDGFEDFELASANAANNVGISPDGTGGFGEDNAANGTKGGGIGSGIATPSSTQAEGIAPGVIDIASWRDELTKLRSENFLSSIALRNKGKSDNWRADLRDIKRRCEAITRSSSQALPIIRQLLEKMTATIQKVQKRETFINTQVAAQATSLREASKTVADDEAQIEEETKNINQLNEAIREVTEKIQEVKDSLSEQNAKLNDTSALSRMKQSVTEMTREMEELDIRVALVQHQLFSLFYRQAVGAP